MRILLVTLLAFAATSCLVASTIVPNVPLIKTNIKLNGVDEDQVSTKQANNVYIDTNKMMAQVSHEISASDIEEDQDDPFITTGSGKPRPIFEIGQDADQWANDVPETLTSSSGGVLSRVKRCGDDDDGDASRARSVRRSRRARRRRAKKAARKARKAAKKAAKSQTTQTTITRKVIQNGQVVSQTSTDGQAVQATAVQQPVVVQSVAPPQAATVQQTVAAPAQASNVEVNSSVKVGA